MTGWNMPPGINENMIPGNRPEDILWEKESQRFCEDCEIKYCDMDINCCEKSHEFEKYFERLLNLY